MRHCLQAIIGNSVVISGSRRITTTSSISKPFVRSVASRSHGLDSQSPGDSKPWQMQIGERLDTKEKRIDRKRPSSRKREVTERETSLHLRYLKDPLKLAEFVRQTLREDNYELAQSVVDEASASIECTVSWNHIMEWQLSKGKMNAAIKSYNDVSLVFTLGWPSANVFADEETSSSSRCQDLHYNFQRVHAARRLGAGPRESVDYVQFHA